MKSLRNFYQRQDDEEERNNPYRLKDVSKNKKDKGENPYSLNFSKPNDRKTLWNRFTTQQKENIIFIIALLFIAFLIYWTYLSYKFYDSLLHHLLE